MTKNHSLLELDFSIGHYNGTMDVTILVNDTCVAQFVNTHDSMIYFSHNIEWPSTVEIQVSGKNLGHDTQVDECGKIIADKYIELRALRIDHIEPGIEYMKSLVLDTGNETINSLYWGFNGQVILHFDHDDSFLWHLAQRVQQNQSYIISQTRI